MKVGASRTVLLVCVNRVIECGEACGPTLSAPLPSRLSHTPHLPIYLTHATTPSISQPNMSSDGPVDTKMKSEADRALAMDYKELNCPGFESSRVSGDCVHAC